MLAFSETIKCQIQEKIVEMASLLGGFFRSVYQKLEINSATLSGAIDVIVVRHDDGTLCSTPFHVTFGKLQLLRSNEKTIKIFVNDEPTNLEMTLGKAGEAFFVVDEDDPRWSSAASPFSSPCVSDDETSVGGSPPSSPRPISPTSWPVDSPIASPSGQRSVELGGRTTDLEDKEGPEEQHRRWSWRWGTLPRKRHGRREQRRRRDDEGEEDVSVDRGRQASGMVRARSLMELSRYETPELSLSVAHAIPASSSEESTHTSLQEATTTSRMKVELSSCGHDVLSLSEQEKKQRFDAYLINEATFFQKEDDLLLDDSLVFRIDGRYYDQADAFRTLVASAVFGADAARRCLDAPLSSENRKRKKRGGKWGWFFRRSRPVNDGHKQDGNDPAIQVKTETLVEEESVFSRESERSKAATEMTAALKSKKRTLIPPSAILQTLNLRDGRNTIRFEAGEGKQVVCSLYVWSQHAKVVISDIDGTITKSDVLGQVLPIVGKDWSHTGVTELYSKIEKNGYKFLYLTARAIGQVETTRTFLRHLCQEGIQLPDGPVLTSPDRMLASLTREVIMRRPQDFKIACLRNVRHIFAADHNPFYAGFGNRMTDVIAYQVIRDRGQLRIPFVAHVRLQSVGVPEGRILTINPSGEVTGQTNSLQKTTYSSLSTLVDLMFPEITDQEMPDEEFNYYNYWKVPLEEIEDLCV